MSVMVFDTERVLTFEERNVVFDKLGLNPKKYNMTFKKKRFSLFSEGDGWERANQHNSGGELTYYHYTITKISGSFRASLKNMANRLISSPVWVTINPDELVQKLPQ